MAKPNKNQTFTAEVMDDLRERFKEMKHETPPPRRSFSQSAVIQEFSKEIRDLFEHGYTAQQISDKLKDKFTLSAALLQREKQKMNKEKRELNITAEKDTSTNKNI